MTGSAVGIARMVKDIVHPTGRIVAIGALAGPVSIWRISTMARLTIDQALVAEGDILPTLCVVTIGTHPVIMACRRSMARLAVAGNNMGVLDIVPALSIMAFGTLTRPVPGWDGMASLAILHTAMAVGSIPPILRVVAAGALNGIVVSRRLFSMAPLAIRL